MTAWKVVFVVAIVASGFGTGYLCNEWNRPATPQAATPVAKVDPQPDGDPLLILPPPDMKGVMLDPAGLMVKDHFRDMAGLKSPTPLPGGLRVPVPTDEPILPAEHQVRPSPEEAAKPVLRVRLNFSLDLDWPSSSTPLPLRPLNQVWWERPETMPMPREVPLVIE